MHDALKSRPSNGITSGVGGCSTSQPIALSEPELRKAFGGVSAGTVAVWRRRYRLPFLQLTENGRILYPYALAVQWAAENATRLHGEGDDQ